MFPISAAVYPTLLMMITTTGASSGNPLVVILRE